MSIREYKEGDEFVVLVDYFSFYKGQRVRLKVYQGTSVSLHGRLFFPYASGTEGVLFDLGQVGRQVRPINRGPYLSNQGTKINV